MDEPVGGGDADLGGGADLVGDFDGPIPGEDIQSEILTPESK